MTATWLFVLCEISVIACGLVSGVFLTFSDFVMKSLAASTPAGGIEAMQIINRKVYRTIFLALFLGMALASPLLIGVALVYVPGAVSAWLMAGSAIYFAGVFLVGGIPENGVRLQFAQHVAYVVLWDQTVDISAAPFVHDFVH